MAEIHNLAPAPDPETMRAQLYALFRHSMRGMVEIGWTDKTGALARAKQFDVGDLDDVVAFAARINATPGQNVYVSAGLRRTDIDRDHRAADKDVIAIAALKADCDNPSCIEEALRLCAESGLRPNLAHYSGREPYPRGALWWVLDEPEPDLERVKAAEAAIARILDSDRKVINSSRVMRLPGSVAWPYKQGRVVEMTGVLDTQAREAPYSLDEIESALRRRDAYSSSPRGNGVVIDLSTAQRSLELESLIQRCREPTEWHQAMLLATAHLTGRGCPPDVAIDVLTPRVTLPGYTEAQTRAELAIMLRGAVAKGWGPAPADPQGQTDPDASPFLTIEEMLRQPPPEYLVDGYLTKRGLSVLWGPSGAFKSFVALDIALSVATGAPWHGRTTGAAKPVLYICAEGQYGFGVRGLAWCAHRLPSGQVAEHFRLLPVPVNMLEPANIGALHAVAEKHGVGAALIMVDTLARNFGAGDESKTQDMNKFIAGADLLGQRFGAHVMLIHHSGKDETKGERGAYALRGAVDTSLQLERHGDGDRVTLHHVKQKDGPELPQLELRVVKAEAVHPLTGEIVASRVPVLDAPQAPNESARLGKNERAVLEILDEGAAKFSTIKARMNVDSGTLGRTLRSLFDKNYVARDDDVWRLLGGARKDEQ